MQIKYLVLILLALQLTSCKKLMGSLLKKHTEQANTWKTLFVDQILDHFSLTNTPQTFKQKILINTENWDHETGSIFFYTGNECEIELVAENTGFPFDIAPQFKAAVVFAEHRYYGDSMPFGNESFSDWKKTQYLTVDQALADFVENIKWLKENYLEGAKETPVITFGGSYGGMLASWMRIRYPNMVQGAIAGSAPVWSFPGMMGDNPTGPYEIVTKVFQDAAENCPVQVQKSWELIISMGGTKDGRDKLQQFFHICKPLADMIDVIHLYEWLHIMYFDMAMVNYPYPTSFLAPLPAWPVKEFCNRASAGLNDTVAAIAAGTQVYSNYTGKVKCLDLDSNPAGGAGVALGIDFQACTEIIIPIASDPAVDMFPEAKFDLDKHVYYCEKQWNTTARPYWLKYSLGGISGFDYYGASNIVFSNGKLDPWAAGGVDIQTKPICHSDCPNLVIEEGAHHLDLRSANPADPPSVLEARAEEIKAITRWTSKDKNNRVDL